MTPDDLDHFYEAALTGGAILSGFIGTFLNFRIQREANYYRQPVLDFNREKPGEVEKPGRAKDVHVNLSRFPISLILVILAGLLSMIFGIVWPLSALAHLKLFMTGPAPILAGVVGSLVLIAAYFYVEMFHYEMFAHRYKPEWDRERGMVVCGILLAGILFAITYCAASHPQP